MSFKIGETIKIKGTDLLVLDVFDGNPFVIALDVDIESKFGHNTNYSGSVLEKEMNAWAEDFDMPTIAREVDLTTMDGSKCYGTITANVAPITFDEFRKYAEIIIPHIKHWFWTCTAWADPKWENWGSTGVCVVNTDGSATGSNYGSPSGRVAPAFVLDKNCLNEPHPNMLSNFSTEQLLAEITKRVKEG